MSFGLDCGMTRVTECTHLRSSLTGLCNISHMAWPTDVATILCCSWWRTKHRTKSDRAKPNRWKPSPWPQKCSTQTNGCDKWLRKFTWPQKTSQDCATWDVLLCFLQSLRVSLYKEWEGIFNYVTNVGCFCWSVCASNILLNAPTLQEPLFKDLILTACTQMGLLTLSWICHFQQQIKLTTKSVNASLQGHKLWAHHGVVR